MVVLDSLSDRVNFLLPNPARTGYYVPKSDGEFYQFCYVTHAGDIRGASTPFQFRAATPTEDLLTVTEDEGNSDILVVTTKTGLLEVRHRLPTIHLTRPASHAPPLPLSAARRGGAAGAAGTVEGHAAPAGGEAAAAGGAEASGQGEGAGEGDVLPAADAQPGERHAHMHHQRVPSSEGGTNDITFKLKTQPASLELLAKTCWPGPTIINLLAWTC